MADVVRWHQDRQGAQEARAAVVRTRQQLAQVRQRTTEVERVTAALVVCLGEVQRAQYTLSCRRIISLARAADLRKSQ